jgi:VanZ family protein
MSLQRLMARSNKQAYKFAAATLWALLIFAACSIPGQDLPNVQIVQIDKFAHFFLFAVFGWAWMYALKSPLKKRALAVLLAGSAYSILIEIYQGLLPWDRSPDIYDVLADVAGLLAGLASSVYLRSRAAKG